MVTYKIHTKLLIITTRHHYNQVFTKNKIKYSTIILIFLVYRRGRCRCASRYNNADDNTEWKHEIVDVLERSMVVIESSEAVFTM